MNSQVNESLLAAMVAVADGLDLNEALHRIVVTAADLVDARYGALGVLGSGGGVSQFVHVGVDAATAERIGPLPQGRGILGLLTEVPESLRLSDLTTHPLAAGFPPGHPPMHSFLGVPILVRGKVYGNLYLTEKRHGQFTLDDAALVEALAAAAGVAIRNARLFARNARREQWQRAVTAVDALMLSGAEVADVADEAARHACALASAAAVVLALPDAAGRLRVAAVITSDQAGAEDPTWSVAHSRLPADIGEQLMRLRDLLGQRLPTDSAHARSHQAGTPLTGPAALVGIPCADLFGPALMLPLVAREQVLGAVGLYRFAGGEDFAEEVRELADAFATQVALALSFGLERRERERLAVFEERDRIARDLHDLVIQRLFATGMMLEGAARNAVLPPVLAERIGVAVDELDATIKEIRTSIFELHEPTDGPSWVGARARVLAEVERVAGGIDPKPRVTFTGPVDTYVSGALAGHLVAAVREGLSNAIRHAGGHTIEVQVTAGPDLVRLSVLDDGVGVPATGPSRRSGLANLADRAGQLGGGCRLANRPGAGAELRWWAPLTG